MKNCITIDGDKISPGGATTAGGVAGLKKSAQKFDFAEVDKLEKKLKEYRDEIVQMEEELNIKAISDQNYTLKKQIMNLKTK